MKQDRTKEEWKRPQYFSSILKSGRCRPGTILLFVTFPECVRKAVISRDLKAEVGPSM